MTLAYCLGKTSIKGACYLYDGNGKLVVILQGIAEAYRVKSILNLNKALGY